MHFEAKTVLILEFSMAKGHMGYHKTPTSLTKRRAILSPSILPFIQKVKEMVDRFIAEAQDRGYTETLGGRKRYLLELNSSNPIARRAAERMATNTPIQGSAADLIKIAMINIDQAEN